MLQREERESNGFSLFFRWFCLWEIIGKGESEKDIGERGERAIVSPYSLHIFVY